MSDPRPDGRTAILRLLGSRPIAYYPALAAIAGGVTAGVFLAQLFYWHDKGADPAGWIYKTQAEWQAETGLTRWEQETARRHLRQRGILEEKLAGIPARLYYRLDVARVIELLADLATDDGAPSADKDVTAPRSSMRQSHNQACGNPTIKNVATPQTSLRHCHTHAETTREHSREKESEKTSAAGSPQVMCTLHGQPMTLRRKDGDTWYSHRLPDGSWCKGAPGDQPGGKPDPQSRAYRREYASQFGIDFSHRVPSDVEGPGEASSSPAPCASAEGSATPTERHADQALPPPSSPRRAAGLTSGIPPPPSDREIPARGARAQCTLPLGQESRDRQHLRRWR
jgi:hypothetical protein